MKKKNFTIFIIFSISLLFISFYYTIYPKSPYSGQIIKLTINLYQLGIFNIDKSKSFLKSLNPSINIISYKFSSKNDKFYLKIKLQIFLTGTVRMSDLVLFDGISYYNFDSIVIPMNLKIDEIYILPVSKNVNKYLTIRILLLYIFFLLVSFFLYIIFVKFKNSLNYYIKKRKESIFLRKNLKILLQLENLNKDSLIGIIKYKENLIKFNNTVFKILNSDLFSKENPELTSEIKKDYFSLSFYSFENPQNLYKMKDSIINKIIETIANKIKKIIEDEYRFNKI